MIIRRDSVDPIAFHGLLIRDYTGGAQTSSSLATVRVEPGARHREAWSRRCDKYYYVVDGTLQFMVDGRTCDLSEGDCCIVQQGQRFWYRNHTNEPVTVVLFHTPSFDLQAEVFANEIGHGEAR